MRSNQHAYRPGLLLLLVLLLSWAHLCLVDCVRMSTHAGLPLLLLGHIGDSNAALLVPPGQPQ
jgi:hypothetical protein